MAARVHRTAEARAVGEERENLERERERGETERERLWKIGGRKRRKKGMRVTDLMERFEGKFAEI